MEKFTKLTGVAAPLPIVNVDTDMIIPKDYLKTIKRTGLGKGLFAEMRFNEDGTENPDFVLNKPAYRKAQILVAGDNFGCGSSREHAPWALLDFGIRCVISTSFADIFYNNCFKNGILPITVSPEDLDKLMDDASRGANATLTDRPRSQGNPRSRRRHDQVRPRRFQAPLPAERPRRYRPDHGKGAVDRRLREGSPKAVPGPERPRSSPADRRASPVPISQPGPPHCRRSHSSREFAMNLIVSAFAWLPAAAAASRPPSRRSPELSVRGRHADHHGDGRVRQGAGLRRQGTRPQLCPLLRQDGRGRRQAGRAFSTAATAAINAARTRHRLEAREWRSPERNGGRRLRLAARRPSRPEHLFRALSAARRSKTAQIWSPTEV